MVTINPTLPAKNFFLLILILFGNVCIFHSLTFWKKIFQPHTILNKTYMYTTTIRKNAIAKQYNNKKEY